MDKDGFFNFGLNASHLKAVTDCADIVIVEVNTNMPNCINGVDDKIHISDVDMIIEGDNPPIDELVDKGEPTEVDKAVAQLIIEEIPNGACLQLGIGGMPNTLGAMIAKSDLKDLGVHTEMYVDAFVDIAKAGKITGTKRSIRGGKCLLLRQEQKSSTTMCITILHVWRLPFPTRTMHGLFHRSITLCPSITQWILTYSVR